MHSRSHTRCSKILLTFIIAAHVVGILYFLLQA